MFPCRLVTFSEARNASRVGWHLPALPRAGLDLWGLRFSIILTLFRWLCDPVVLCCAPRLPHRNLESLTPFEGSAGRLPGAHRSGRLGS